jgi:hypothetical protein
MYICNKRQWGLGGKKKRKELKRETKNYDEEANQTKIEVMSSICADD